VRSALAERTKDWPPNLQPWLPTSTTWTGGASTLQSDARHTTTQEIGDKVGVSPSTVRNRSDRLEDDGVITDYHPRIDYEAADVPLRVQFVDTVPPTDRSAAVDELLDIEGVVDVKETVTGRPNRFVEAVGTATVDITRMTDSVHELGLEIESPDRLKQHWSQPFDHFHYEGDIVGEEVMTD